MKRVLAVPPAMALLLAMPTLRNGFAIDDTYLIVDNAALRDLTRVGAFFSQPWGNSAGGEPMYTQVNAAFWRPLSTSLMAIEHAMFGAAAAPYHAVSAGLHALATALVTVLCMRITCSQLGALAAGLLFAVHPVHSEVVAAVTYQTSLLSALLSLASLLAVQDALEHGPRLRHLIACSVLPGLALLAKEDAVTVPLLALAQVLTQRTDWRRTVLLRGWLPIVLSTSMALIARSAIVVSAGITYFGEAPAGTVVRTMLAVVVLYARLLIAPLRLCVFYDWFIIPFHHAVTLDVLLGAAIVAATIVALVVSWRRGSQVALGLCWLSLPLLPVMHLVPILNVAAERFLYLPTVGLCLLLAIAVAHHPPRRTLRLAGVALLALLGLRSVVRLADWRSDRVLNEATARDFPETPTPLMNLAALDLKAKDSAAARVHLEEALRRAPGFPPALERLRELDVLESDRFAR